MCPTMWPSLVDGCEFRTLGSDLVTGTLAPKSTGKPRDQVPAGPLKVRANGMDEGSGHRRREWFPPAVIADFESGRNDVRDALVSELIEMQSILVPETRIIEYGLRPEVHDVAVVFFGKGQGDFAIFRESR